MANLTGDLRVIQRDPYTGKITFGMSTIPTQVTGIDKLVQTFVFALMNDPGRDVLDPTQGAGLMSMLGQYNLDPYDKTPIIDEIYRRMDKASDDIKRSQDGLTNEDPNAMLNTFRLINVEDTSDIDGVNIKVRLISMAGTTVDISV